MGKVFKNEMLAKKLFVWIANGLTVMILFLDASSHIFKWFCLSGTFCNVFRGPKCNDASCQKKIAFFSNFAEIFLEKKKFENG